MRIVRIPLLLRLVIRLSPMTTVFAQELSSTDRNALVMAELQCIGSHDELPL